MKCIDDDRHVGQRVGDRYECVACGKHLQGQDGVQWFVWVCRKCGRARAYMPAQTIPAPDMPCCMDVVTENDYRFADAATDEDRAEAQRLWLEWRRRLSPMKEVC